MPASRNITVENVNTPGRTERVDAEKYEAMSQVLLAALSPCAPGFTHAQRARAVRPHHSPPLWQGGAKAMVQGLARRGDRSHTRSRRNHIGGSMTPASTPHVAATRRQRWSQQVTGRSNALDLEPGVFTWDDPAAIARSLKASAQASRRRKASPFRSAMSMLNFYVNRAGAALPAERRACLHAAKDELRVLFGRPRHGAAGRRR